MQNKNHFIHFLLIFLCSSTFETAISKTTKIIKMADGSSDVTLAKGTTSSKQFDKSHSVKAKTQYGEIEGFLHTADEGTKSNVFLGIPYAAPPVGELRFERPVSPQNWSQTLQCKEFRDSCIPYTKQWIQNPKFSEDCLYVNVIAPAAPSSDPKGYPVLVYIHGGGFGFGDVVKCGFDKITKNYAKRGLITVTVPYRVGLYGFMSLGTKEDSGNIGLWDQTAALKFIKNNIKNFGGNNENITIWGQSAGSASVDLMALSPHSRDYFHKVIQASGAALDEWASTAPVIKVTKQIAKVLGCESEDPKNIKAFLKKQKWEDIMEVSSTKFDSTDKTKDNYIGFGPRYDDDFFDGKTVEQLIEEAPKKPTIMGLMTLEGGIFLLFAMTPEDIKTYSGKNITNAIKYRYAPESRAGKDAPGLQQDLIEYFVNRDAPTTPNPLFYLQRHGELASDLMFNQEVFKEADLKTKLGWPIYFYFWNHMSKEMYAATGSIAKGAWHSYDLSYSFDQVTYPQDVKGDPELKVQNYFADFFAQFAKTGNPKTDTIPFPKYTVDKQEALWIDPELSVQSQVWEDRRKFWDNVTEKYDYNVLRGRTRKQIKNRYTD